MARMNTAMPTSDDFEDILFEVKDNVAWITINRPDTRNAFREHTLDELIHAFKSTRNIEAVLVARSRQQYGRVLAAHAGAAKQENYSILGNARLFNFRQKAFVACHARIGLPFAAHHVALQAGQIRQAHIVSFSRRAYVNQNRIRLVPQPVPDFRHIQITCVLHDIAPPIRLNGQPSTLPAKGGF